MHPRELADGHTVADAGSLHDLSCPGGADAVVSLQQVPDGERAGIPVTRGQDITRTDPAPVHKLQDLALAIGQILRALPRRPGRPGAGLGYDRTVLRLLVVGLTSGGLVTGPRVLAVIRGDINQQLPGRRHFMTTSRPAQPGRVTSPLVAEHLPLVGERGIEAHPVIPSRMPCSAAAIWSSSLTGTMCRRLWLAMLWKVGAHMPRSSSFLRIARVETFARSSSSM